MRREESGELDGARTPGRGILGRRSTSRSRVARVRLATEGAVRQRPPLVGGSAERVLSAPVFRVAHAPEKRLPLRFPGRFH